MRAIVTASPLDLSRRAAGMRGEELPQCVRRERRPLVPATVDGLQYDASACGAVGRRCGHRSVGRDHRRPALVDAAPECVEIGHRRPVDASDADAGFAVVADQPIGGAVDVHDRGGMRRAAAVQLGCRVRPDGRKRSGVAGQRVGHHAAVADAGGVDAVGVDADVGADLADHRIDEADVVEALAA